MFTIAGCDQLRVYMAQIATATWKTGVYSLAVMTLNGRMKPEPEKSA
jgi:hypothetical protein